MTAQQITGTVYVDLSDATGASIRARVAGIGHAPSGARVVVHVGALTVDTEAGDLLRRYAERHPIDVRGTAHAVRQWVAFLSWHPGLV